jgi:hypothetical protein
MSGAVISKPFACNKVLQAARIGYVQRGPFDSRLYFKPEGPFDDAAVVENSIGAVDVPNTWVEHYRPQIDGYFLRLEDGSYSYLPGPAFWDLFSEVAP